MQSRSFRTVPNRDGLMFSHCGDTGSLPTSRHEWIGASKLKPVLARPRAPRGSPSSSQASSITTSGNVSCNRAIELGVGRKVDAGAVVVRLEVERRGRGRSQPAAPSAAASHPSSTSSLNSSAGSSSRYGAIVRARRRDEPHRAVGPPDDVGERPPGLPQRQIERRALEGPAAVVDRRVHPRLLGQSVELVQPHANSRAASRCRRASHRPGSRRGRRRCR